MRIYGILALLGFLLTWAGIVTTIFAYDEGLIMMWIGLSIYLPAFSVHHVSTWVRCRLRPWLERLKTRGSQ